MADWHEIYEFWFGAPESDDHGSVRELWFGGGPSVDREISTRFAGPYQRAVAGELGNWTSQARSWVSLIVLLDQFPRNISGETAGPSLRTRRRWKMPGNWWRARCTTT